ncbi:MAG: hypothetical protein AAFP02_08420 [Bacteroidota bacterium]
MTTKSTVESVCACPHVKARAKDSHARFWQKGKFLPAILAIVLPKCPLCLLTYSGAVGVCGAANIGHSYANWSIVLASLFLSLIFVVLQLNHKGGRTFLAQFLLAIGGSTLLSYMLFGLPEVLFYGASALILFSAWLNASFLHFFYAIINKS